MIPVDRLIGIFCTLYLATPLVIIVCLLSLVLPWSDYLASAASEGNSQNKWLGRYVGPQIPGYQVVRSEVLTIGTWGSADNLLRDEGKQPLGLELDEICRDKNRKGVGIVNYRTTSALGVVPGPASAPNTYISNGMYREAYGDCVLEVTPRAR